MRLIIAFILVISLCSAYAKDEHCKELVIWNPATKDTLMHFHRKASDLMTKDGSCYYNTGWTARLSHGIVRTCILPKMESLHSRKAMKLR